MMAEAEEERPSEGEAVTAGAAATATVDEEPKLKYRRMANDMSDLLLKDSISCIAVHPKFVCVGSERGFVRLLDHDGNLVDRVSLRSHSVAVNVISVDSSGDHVASCSDDGKVLVHGLYSSDGDYTVSGSRAVKSVALDPDYRKPGAGCRFLVADGRLLLYERTYFNRLKSTVLFEGDSRTGELLWRGRFVAWASDAGVRVYDVVAGRSLGLIRRNPDDRGDPHRCNLAWIADDTVAIGWTDKVRICRVRKRTAAELEGRSVPDHVVDPTCTFRVDYLVCGLAPLDGQLVVLGYPKDREGDRPSLNTVDYSESPEVYETWCDSIDAAGFERRASKDYRLASVPGENLFYVVSPKDLVTASQCDVDDHVRWAVERGLYDRAMTLLEEAGGDTAEHSIASVGVAYMDRLLERGEHDRAAALLAKVCASDGSLWEREIRKFADADALRSVCPFLPTEPERRLPPQIYESALRERMKLRPVEFLRLLQTWDPSLYRSNVIVGAAIEHLLVAADADRSVHLEALAVLYCHQRKYDKALSMYLKLRHPAVFDLIKRHNLYHLIHDKILALMRLDCDAAVSMLLDKTEVPSSVVESQLASNDFYLYKYLDALGRSDEGGKYHGRLVRLYAEFAREKLLNFLKSRDSYPIEEALRVCDARDLYPEKVYLLGRMGNAREALGIIVDKVGDVDWAISFCQEHDDAELWADLIRRSSDRPRLITPLLERMGDYADPRVLVRDVRGGCEIPGLKDSLCRMMRDYGLRLSAREACKSVTLRDYFDMHRRLIAAHEAGVRVSDEYVCGACHEKIIVTGAGARDDGAVLYNCRHGFHSACLPPDPGLCALCNAVAFK